LKKPKLSSVPSANSTNSDWEEISRPGRQEFKKHAYQNTDLPSFFFTNRIPGSGFERAYYDGPFQQKLCTIRIRKRLNIAISGIRGRESLKKQELAFGIAVFRSHLSSSAEIHCVILFSLNRFAFDGL
jgi:hypothetical protein